ncbi:MAG: hypothetical protein M0R46_01695 [Candidatus Muirbacterium halophilum]|nr:hypothetical protein [Candidatus Muirbacterium halophilum]MCK9474608.1 hypothetical protein [Candidatus Muirbacterium halophilum]
MFKFLIVGVATENNIKNCLNIFNSEYKKHQIDFYYLSTKKIGFNFNFKENFLLSEDFFVENTIVPDNIFDEIIIIQNNIKKIEYLNVYKCFFKKKYSVCKIMTSEHGMKSIDLNYIFENENNIDQVFWVSPFDINFVANCFGNDRFGELLDGDWDIDKFIFKDKIDFYNSFIDVRLKKKNWNETAYFKRNIYEIEIKKKIKWGTTNRKEFLERCIKLESIFDEMKNEGWKQKKNSDYVTINIDRNGEILFNDGRHRLTFAKLLNIEKIPVKIMVRHEEWVKKRKKLMEKMGLKSVIETEKKIIKEFQKHNRRIV